MQVACLRCLPARKPLRRFSTLRRFPPFLPCRTPVRSISDTHPVDIGHRSGPNRTPFRSHRKTVRHQSGRLSDFNRNTVRFESERCPTSNRIGVRFASEYAPRSGRAGRPPAPTALPGIPAGSWPSSRSSDGGAPARWYAAAATEVSSPCRQTPRSAGRPPPEYPAVHHRPPRSSPAGPTTAFSSPIHGSSEAMWLQYILNCSS